MFTRTAAGPTRRVLMPVLVGVAIAAPATMLAAPPAAASAAGAPVCTITNHRLIGLSGLIVTKDGFIAISDSNVDKSAIRIWYLDRSCRLMRSVGYPTAADDPEDVAIGRDGTLYVADTGDNDRTRGSIAVWRLASGASTPKIFRYAYPDGPHDAEAILLAPDDTPIFVTKDPFEARLYVPVKPADPSGVPVPLKRVGSFAVSFTGTPNGLGTLGSVVVDGGAQTADRRKVALRTYADAYEWAVPDGDVVKAITTTSPTVTPLPGEPFGESIAYGRDGTGFYTVSDLETQPIRATILRYPSAIVAGPPSSQARASAVPGGAAVRPAARNVDRRTTYALLGFGIVAAVAAIGVVLVAVVAVRSRRRRPKPAGTGTPPG